MSATVRASYYGASAGEPAGASAETGIVFSRSDAMAPAAGTAPIPKPVTADGTAYSWIMLLALECTASDATSMSNRTIAFSDAPAAGSTVFFGQLATYRQPAAGNKPADEATDGPETPTPGGAGAPASYTEVTTTPAVWDAGSDSLGTTGRKGDFAELVFAVDTSFAGGGGALDLNDILLAYDES